MGETVWEYTECNRFVPDITEFSLDAPSQYTYSHSM
jgi:hypothetical protein